jgi:hypothetical protein
MDAWRLSKDARVWFELLVKHCFPHPDSAGGFSIRLKQWRAVKNSPDPSVVPASYLLDAERFGQQALRAYCGHDPASWRRLRAAAERGRLPLDLTGMALVAYRELYIEAGTRPTCQQLHERVLQEMLRLYGGSGRFSQRTWERTLRDIRGLFLDP